jgi:hypothetical protein
MTSCELASCIGAWHIESLETITETSPAIEEILEQNAKWWRSAAVHCATVAARVESDKMEEWLFISGVYRERSDIHARLLERLRRGENPPPTDQISFQGPPKSRKPIR